MTHDDRVDVAVIGAGPYGLSIAAHLRARGVHHVVFGQTMSSWRERMPRGMYLKSEGFASNLSDPGGTLTLERFCREQELPYGHLGVPVPLETFCRYGEWFRSRAEVSVDDSRVERLSSCPDGSFTLDLSDARAVRADRVVLAVGTTTFAYVPPELRALPAGALVHSSAIANPSEYEGRRVAIIGGGSSALELGALMTEAGAEATIVARSLPRFGAQPALPGSTPLLRRLSKPTSDLCAGWGCLAFSRAQSLFHRLPSAQRARLVESTFGPLGAWWLRGRVEGVVRTLAPARVAAADGDGDHLRVVVRHAGRDEELRVDAVVAATGFRPDVGALPFVAPPLGARISRTGRYPRLTHGFETSVPGLHIVGVLAAYGFGPSMRFVAGTKFAAPRVADRHAEGTRSRRRSAVLV